MICKNCGAQYDGNSGICPYCGREDAGIAREKHNKRIRGLLNQRDSIQNLPDTITRRVSKKLWLLLLAFAIILVAGIAIAGIIAKQANKNKLADEQARLEQYEQLLTEKKYEDLYNAVNSASSTYGFQKYTEVTGIYYTYKQIVKYCDYYEDDKANNRPKDGIVDDIIYVIRNLAKMVNDYEGYVSDNKHYGNDSYLKEIKDLAYDYVAKHIGVNESILDKACEIDNNYKANYDKDKEMADYKALAQELLDKK